MTDAFIKHFKNNNTFIKNFKKNNNNDRLSLSTWNNNNYVGVNRYWPNDHVDNIWRVGANTSGRSRTISGVRYQRRSQLVTLIIS